MNWMIVWFALGWVGFVGYLSNPSTRPSKKRYYPVPFCTFAVFGPIALLYGYFCFSGRKNKRMTNAC